MFKLGWERELFERMWQLNIFSDVLEDFFYLIVQIAELLQNKYVSAFLLLLYEADRRWVDDIFVEQIVFSDQGNLPLEDLELMCLIKLKRKRRQYRVL